MKKFTKILALVLSFAMILAFAACGEKKNEGTDDKTYDLSKEGEYTAENTEFFIGATGPLTGPNSSYGISVNNGAQLAVDEINAAGGLNGIKFKFEMKDDKSQTKDAETGYNSLLEAGMQASLGSVTSGSAEAFATLADEDGVFSLTPSASADPVINASSYAFRVCFGDPDNGVLAAQELTKTYTNIGVIYDKSDSYSNGIFQAFKAEMEKQGKTFIEQSFDAEHKLDFSTQVEALKDCDAIFLPIYYTEAGLIAKACSAKGCNAFLFGSDGLDGVKGQLDETVTNKISYITPFDIDSTKEVSANFTKNYKAKYNADPDQFAADGYDAVYAIYEAMKVLNVDNAKVDPAELGKALVATFTSDTFTYDGVTGEMKWDASGACTKKPNIKEVQ